MAFPEHRSVDYFKEREIEVGDSAVDVYRILLGKLGVVEAQLITHEVGLNWSQKYPDEYSRRLNFLEAFEVNREPPNNFFIKTEKFNQKFVDDIQRSLPPNNVVSATSLVKTDEGLKHIPMINFHLEGGFTTEEILMTLKHNFPGMRGAVLHSGRGYHYYGEGLLSQRDWEMFMGIFLIPFNLVHPGYVGYRLCAGYSALRLTKNVQFKPKIPQVVLLVE